jgi:hypothetical protein
MTLTQFFNEASKEFPELKTGIERREIMAKNLARKDGILLNRNSDELEPVYLDLLLNVCTEEMLIKIRDMEPKERLKCADALQSFGKET